MSSRESARRLVQRAQARQRRMPLPVPAGAEIPLAGLRAEIIPGSGVPHWAMDVEGTRGRSLVHQAGAEVGFPLRLAGEVWLRGSVRLVPRDWQLGSGSARAIVRAQLAGGEQELWAENVGAAAEGGPDTGVPFAVTVPAGTERLTLAVTYGRIRGDRSAGRVIWVEPALIEPGLPTATHAAPAAANPVVPSGAQAATGITTAGPLISVLTPVHDPPLAMLEPAIASVLAQTFTDWELCLVDDGSRRPEIIAALERHAAADPRIRLVRHNTAQGISGASNAALAMARGEYVALLDHDDLLAPTALAQVAARIAGDPTLDMVYSDEHVVEGDRTLWRMYKPGWSPENMAVLMYTCHLGVYRRSLADEIGGFRPAYDGCQDYDFVLRFAERSERIAHIPHPLYQWRAHAGSTAGDAMAKPYAFVAQPRAIARYLERTGAADATVHFGAHPGMHRIVFPVAEERAITIVLATVDSRGTPVSGLADAARTWAAQPHAGWRVTLAGPAGTLTPALEELVRAGVAPARIATVTAEADAAAALTAGAAAAARNDGLLALMQAPMGGLTHDWLRGLAGYAEQPGIAGAGPVVLDPQGRIAESGIVAPHGIPLPVLHGAEVSAARDVAMNVSALSGMLVVRGEVLNDRGGLHAACGEHVLTDFGLRATGAGLRSVLLPDIRLGLQRPDYLGNDLAALRAVHRLTGGDPYYSPNFRSDRGDFVALEREVA